MTVLDQIEKSVRMPERDSSLEKKCAYILSIANNEIKHPAPILGSEFCRPFYDINFILQAKLQYNQNKRKQSKSKLNGNNVIQKNTKCKPHYNQYKVRNFLEQEITKMINFKKKD